ncbi:hypothetical protein QWZ13_18460 [Reinekea marina]|nr:hypothetical protein [Reinekea marina]MDN3650895.1 hypothetical protein [Reinekea marina]
MTFDSISIEVNPYLLCEVAKFMLYKVYICFIKVRSRNSIQVKPMEGLFTHRIDFNWFRILLSFKNNIMYFPTIFVCQRSTA